MAAATLAKMVVGTIVRSGGGEGGGGEGGGKASPENKVGLMRAIVVPSPSWPWPLAPQHLRSALLVTYAHVWEFPSASSPTAPPTLIVVGV